MIKVGKTISELDILAKTYYNEILAKLNLEINVQQKLDDAKNTAFIEKIQFYIALQLNLKKIIISKPDELETISTQLMPLYTALETSIVNLLPPGRTRKAVLLEKRKLRDEIISIFDYPSFTSYDSGSWAYEHAKRIGLNVCPYCNSQYTFTIKTSKGKTRPQFDHFFKKSRYPYFALSFYNLIPSCYACNANLKGQHEFKPSTHIHPFIEGVEDTLHFRTNIDKVDFLLGKKDFNIVLQKVPLASPIKLSRAIRSSKIFHIEEQYRFHKDYTGEIIYKAYLYTDSKINELINNFHGANGIKLFSSKEEIIEMLFGNYLREEKLHERVLAKLTKNIANEMGVNL